MSTSEARMNIYLHIWYYTNHIPAKTGSDVREHTRQVEGTSGTQLARIRTHARARETETPKRRECRGRMPRRGRRCWTRWLEALCSWTPSDARCPGYSAICRWKLKQPQLGFTSCARVRECATAPRASALSATAQTDVRPRTSLQTSLHLYPCS